MGRVYLEHMGGSRLYCCAKCGTFISIIENVICPHYLAPSGQAVLFKKVVNVTYGDREEREMITGCYVVRDVYCKRCTTNLGWRYETARELSQKFKGKHTALEQALL